MAAESAPSKSSLGHFTVRFAANECVYEKGDPGTTMFVVQSGEVSLYDAVGGEDREIGRMAKGDFFGETSVLEGLPRTTSARALRNSELLEISGATFDKMINGNMEIAVRLLRKLSLRLRDADRRNAELQATMTMVKRNSEETRIIRDEAEAPRPTTADGARLELEGGPVFTLDTSECMIGRFDPVTELKPDVDLTDVDLKRSVSRRHARIVLSDEGYELIEEIGALNGTYLNGTRLATGEGQLLSDGDRVNLGTVQMLFRC